MASPGNQHCASCIGTLSFPIVWCERMPSGVRGKCLLVSIYPGYDFLGCDLIPPHQHQQQVAEIGANGLHLLR